MRRLLIFSIMLIALVSLVIASRCYRSSNDEVPHNNAGARTASTPDNTNGNSTKAAYSDGSSEQPPGLDEVTFFGKGDVSIKTQGSQSFSPQLHGSFRTGDRLKIGEAPSFVSVLCPDRFCKLYTGEYDACCTASCTQVAPMMRIEAGDNPPVVRKAELSSANAKTLNDAELNIRSLDLGPVTTQFLITKLYSGWKLEETNQELDRLTIQLTTPEAKQELQQSYLPVIRKTGDMQRKLNRIDKAKELYQKDISSSTDVTDPIEKAAAHARLAEAYKESGNKDEAVRNYQAAKDIYVKQGETKAAAATEKQIVNTQEIKRIDKTTLRKGQVNAVKP